MNKTQHTRPNSYLHTGMAISLFLLLGNSIMAQGVIVENSVYGGGALANVSANTVVDILGGTVEEGVYGGGLGQKTGVNGATSDVAALVGGTATVNIGASSDADIEAGNSAIVHNVYGCNNINGTPQGAVTVNIYATHREGKNLASYTNDDATYSITNVFGGGNQASYLPTSAGTITSVIVHGCYNTIENLYGGGNAADVGSSTTNSGVAVTINGGRFDWVFGGGNGAGASNPGANIYGGVNLTVNAGIIGHLFGGSNEKGTITGTKNLQLTKSGSCFDNQHLVAELYGGNNKAPGTDATLTVACTSPQWNINSVFGGSRQADLTGDVELNIYGGTYESIFGGNNTSGTIGGSVDLNVYGGTIDYVYGGNNEGGDINGIITVNIDSNTACPLTISHNVYGGGNLALYDPSGDGTVAPVVNLINGTVGGSVFGGGRGDVDAKADADKGKVTGNPKVNMTFTLPKTDSYPGTNRNFRVQGNIYGGGEMATVVGYPQINIATGRVGIPDEGDAAHNAELTAGHSSNDKGHVFGGGLGSASSAYATFAFVDSTEVNITGGYIVGSVFGGGENGRVTGNTGVKISGGRIGMNLSDFEHRETDGQGVEIYFGNVYGGGRGIAPVIDASYSQTAGQVEGDTWVIINGGRVTHNVYGGGSLASVGKADVANSGTAHVKITGGIIGYADGADNISSRTTFTNTGAYSYDSEAMKGSNRSNIQNFYLRAGLNEGRVYGSGRGQVGNNDILKNLAFVNNSIVTIGGTGATAAQVRGCVFGGGANGHVRYDANTTITGDAMIGVPLMNAVDWDLATWKESPDGYISHDTLVVSGVNTLSQTYYATDIDAATGGHLHERWVATDGTGPTIYRGNVYGGGRGITPVSTAGAGSDITKYQYSATAGRVYGNVELNITGGTIFDDVYGGGSLASVGNEVDHVDATYAYGLWGNQFALSGFVDSIANNATDMKDSLLIRYTRDYTEGDPITGTGNIVVNISAGQIGTDGIGNGFLYGGGRGIAGATQDSYVDVTDLAFANNTYVNISGTAAIKGSAFGGGANGHVMQNTYVRMYGGTVGVRLPLAERKVDESTGHGYRVYRGNLYGGGRGVDPLTDGLHLSNTAGRVYGNTRVLVVDGQVYHSVYGGGSLASVGTYVLEDNKHYYVQGTGQATVTIKGNAHIGHSSIELEQDVANYDAAEIHTAIKLGGINQSTYDGYSAEQKKQFLTEMNYRYIGANSAMVFGSGRGIGALTGLGAFYANYAEAAFTHNTIVTLLNDNTKVPVVAGSVFGGGENGHVKHNTFVNIQGGKVGGIPLHDANYKPYDDGFSSDASLVLRLEYEDIEDESGVGPSVYRGNVYGGGRGVDHSDINESTKGYSPSAGRVYGNTVVEVSGGTIYHHVFGGGSLASVGTYDTNANGQPTAMQNIICLKAYKGATLGSYVLSSDAMEYTTGNTTVTIRGGVIGRMGWNEGSVFGGGRGIAGKNTSQVTHLAYVNDTKVNIEAGANIMGCVFGGGANGHVFDSTLVTISGGIVGHPLEEADTLTTIYGYAPRTVFRGNVYGGGRGVDPIGVNRLSRSAGRVYGNTHVLMTGGWVRHSIFGGGSMASVGDYDTLTADGTYDGFSLKKGDVSGLAAGRDESHSGRAWVEITGGYVGSQAKSFNYLTVVGDGKSYPDATDSDGSSISMVQGQGGEGRDNGRVFGSCRGTAGEGYDKLAYVNITRVIIGNKDSHTGPKIMGCVFGSGENGHVLDSTLVQMHGGEIGRGKVYDWKRTYIGNLYGGGRGIDLDHNNTLSETAGWVRKSTHVEMTGGRVWHNVYGGGSLASVGPLVTPAYTNTYDTTVNTGRTWVEITGGKVGRDGLFGGNVFGSGRGRAGENIDTVFHLCNTECTYVPDVANPTSENVTINGNIYGVRTLMKVSNPAEDSLYLAVIRSKVAPHPDSIYYVLTAKSDESAKTVSHDFSNRTNIHNAKVIINYAAGNSDTSLHRICGSVYGSGDNGHVLNIATVAVKSGTIGNRFKNFDDAARTAYLAKYPVADRDEISANIASNGMVLTAGSVYGSGRGLDLTNVGHKMSATAGRVYGHTVVNVTGGHVMRNVYGGGNMAGVGQGTRNSSGELTESHAEAGTTHVTVDGTVVIGEVYNTVENSERGQWGGNVFGSSRGLSANTTLVKNMAFVRETYVNINNGTIYGSVFGGGENGHVWHNTHVTIAGGTIGYDNVASISEPVYPGNVYGGGRGIDLTDATKVSRTSGAVYGNTEVLITGGTIYHNVFGGGSLASVGRYVYFDTDPKRDSVLHVASASEVSAEGITPGIASWGKSTVTIRGGIIGTDASNNGRVFGAGRGIAGQDGDGNAFNYYTFVDQTEVNIEPGAEVHGCVFGSGDNGHVSGNTVVNVSGGTIGTGDGGPTNGNVFGSGRGADRGRKTMGGDPYFYSATAGRVRGNTQVNITGGLIKNNVYGGGFMASVLGNTEVNIGTEAGGPSDFAIWGDVFGGSALGTIGSDGNTTTVNILSGTIGSASEGYNAGKKGNIFGGGNGDAGASGAAEAVTLYEDGTEDTPDADSKRDANVLNTVQVNIGHTSQYTDATKGATILGNVFGCNNIAGSPKADVHVDVYSTAHVAGDGISSGNVYPTTLKAQAPEIDVLDTNDINALTPDQQTALLDEARFALNEVYGGGNKADYLPASASNTTGVTIHECEENTIKYVYGGGRAADIGESGLAVSTTVLIEGGHIKQVFAGGDGHTQDGHGNFLAANILGDATLNIEGGIIEQAFGGSNTTGMVHGTARVNFSPVSSCRLMLDEAFGGGNRAEGGSTIVTIPCGFSGSKTIYGGANEARIVGDVTLNIEGGKLTRVFGGSKSADITGNVTVNVYGGSIDELFGGNDEGGNIGGTIEVNVDWGLNTCPDDTLLRYVYGGGYKAPYAPNSPYVATTSGEVTYFTPVVNIIQATVDTAVFGGGFGVGTDALTDAHINANPKVVIGAYRVKDHDGNTIDAQPNNYVRIGREKNTLGRTLAGNVFGGGNAGPVNGSPKVVIQGSDTKVWHNVYGGGNAAMVKGNPDIEIGGNVLLSVPKVTQSGSTVTLTSREGATIHYTIDDTEPTTSSATYSAPLTGLTAGTVVKAIAHKDDFAGPTKTSGVVIYTVTE